MTAAIGTSTIGGNFVETVNGKPGPHPVLTAADVGATTPADVNATRLAFRDQRIAEIQAVVPLGNLFVSYLVLDTAVDGGSPGGVLPGPVAGGFYRWQVTVLTSGTAKGTDIEVQLIVDGGLTIQGPLAEFGIDGGRFGFTGSFPGFPLTAGDHTFDLQLAQPVSVGLASVIAANLELTRLT